MKIVRGIYHKPDEEFERVVYAHTVNSVLEQIKLKCGLIGNPYRFKEKVGLKLDLFMFDANAKGIIQALNQGLRDGADYGE